MFITDITHNTIVFIVFTKGIIFVESIIKKMHTESLQINLEAHEGIMKFVVVRELKAQVYRG